jgi:hypothetical protein
LNLVVPADYYFVTTLEKRNNIMVDHLASSALPKRMQFIQATRLTLLSLICVTALAACGGDGGEEPAPVPPPTGESPAPSPVPSPTASPTPSASPAPSPTPSPAATPTPTPTPTMAPTPVPPPTETELKTLAATFPAMPKDSAELLALRGTTQSQFTFSSGLPLNDLEYTIFDTDYIDGETNGYDTFMPVDPSRPVPGADQIKLITTTGNVTLDNNYGGQLGDRIILGTAEIASPFFLRGSDNVDNDYVAITSFNYKQGHIQLRGSASDYALVRCTVEEGCKTDGFYLFHTASGKPDLMAFVFKCDDLPPTAVGNNEQVTDVMCNDSKTLSLSDSKQFVFAKPAPTTPVLPTQTQIGTSGKEVVAGITVDAAGNQYLIGQTDGSFKGGSMADNRIFVARVNADGTPGWTYEVSMSNGSLLFDATTDSEYIYAVGRTLGALPGFTNAGLWDGIILKIRLSDGTLAASSQWGNERLDGYGNVELDDAGNLYVSGAGSPVGATGTDNMHLVAKHKASDLSNVWRQIVPPQATGTVLVSEAWGGLTYVSGAAPGQGKIVAAGWFMGQSGASVNANGFIEVWTDLQASAPTRTASTVIAGTGIKADWVLDNAVDSAGNIYAVGFTTGDLQGTHKGNGDAYIVKYDANLQNPVFRQVGTAQADAFRRMRVDSAGNLYAVGYTYGDWAGSNADASKRTGDVIMQKFDNNLNPVAALQFGSALEERSYMDLHNGVLYAGGMTEAAVATTSKGSFDGFVVKIDPATMKVK